MGFVEYFTQKGMEQGVQQGMQQGVEQGRQEVCREMVRVLLKNLNNDKKTVAQLLELTDEEIDQFLKDSH